MKQPTMYKGKYVLELNLTGQWFSKVFKRSKPEEYRRICDHWKKYFKKTISRGIKIKVPYANAYLPADRFVIKFSNGYAPDRDWFIIDLKEIVIGEGREKWGANPGEEYFILKLWEVLDFKIGMKYE